MSRPEHTAPADEPDDITGCDDTSGNAYLVERYEHTGEIVFRDDDGRHVAGYTFATFASVTGSLALDLGHGLIISAQALAELQQWANLDPVGLRQRIRLGCGVVRVADLDPAIAAQVASTVAASRGRCR